MYSFRLPFRVPSRVPWDLGSKAPCTHVGNTLAGTLGLQYILHKQHMDPQAKHLYRASSNGSLMGSSMGYAENIVVTSP